VEELVRDVGSDLVGGHISPVEPVQHAQDRSDVRPVQQIVERGADGANLPGQVDR